MTKKWIAVFLSIMAAVLIMAGCGNTNSSGSSGNTASESNTPASSAPADSNTSASDNGGSAQGSGKTEEITVTAKNFEFDKKEIHVKKGDTVKLTLKSAQGSHGLEIPDYNVNIQNSGTKEFVADKAGTFDFYCSVMCGTGHDNMTGKLIVEE